LERSPQVRGLLTSPFIETEPVGGPAGQPLFLNAAAVLETTLSPLGTLRLLQRIEARHGREREREDLNGPRPLDLDLLIHGEALLATPELRLPHPRMADRRFVLEPLAALIPDLVPPGWGRSVAQALHALRDGAPVPVRGPDLRTPSPLGARP
jgi:2-amino-4-hydroxy-6-hydroxymethyldihydropteridine diphosphokinase